MTWQSELPHEHRGEFYLAIDSLPAVEKLNQGLILWISPDRHVIRAGSTPAWSCSRRVALVFYCSLYQLNVTSCLLHNAISISITITIATPSLHCTVDLQYHPIGH